MSGKPFHIQSTSPQETREFGARLGRSFVGGEVIALLGPLGAGKTQLVKGIAAGVNDTDSNLVTSPTFVLVNEYPGRLHIYHLDAYRLAGSNDLQNLGFDEMMHGGSVVIVEWADRAIDALPVDHGSIRIEPSGPSSRLIILEGVVDPTNVAESGVTGPTTENRSHG